MLNKIVIVGVGLIGGSLGLSLRRKNNDRIIIGVSSQTTIASALEMGAINEGYGYDDLEIAVRDADAVFLCTPIHRIQELLTTLSAFIQPGVLVTDVGSTKRVITSHASEVLPEGVHFIGGHPMTGSEKRGVLAADPFLFQNAIYVLCPGEDVPEERLQEFSDLLTGIGASIVLLEADLHDRIAAAVSHVPQMLAVSLVNMIGTATSDSAPYLQLAAGGFRDMTRIASSPFSMWNDICRTNADAIRETIDTYINRLSQLKNRIGTESLGSDFETANRLRQNIPTDTKGFMRALFEVLVVVEDKPGVIAHIANELAQANINIKDIEIVKVREGEGGTLRLAFDSEKEASEVIQLLKVIGYTSRLRK